MITSCHGPLARYVKLRVTHAPGMPGTFSPPLRVSDPDMHHGTCVTHVPWYMPGSLTNGFLWSRWQGGNVPGIPGACATRNFTYLARGPWKRSPYYRSFVVSVTRGFPSQGVGNVNLWYVHCLAGQAVKSSRDAGDLRHSCDVTAMNTVHVLAMKFAHTSSYIHYEVWDSQTSRVQPFKFGMDK